MFRTVTTTKRRAGRARLQLEPATGRAAALAQSKSTPRVLMLANGHRITCLERAVFWASCTLGTTTAPMVKCVATASDGRLVGQSPPILATAVAELDAHWEALHALLDRLDPLPVSTTRPRLVEG